MKTILIIEEELEPRYLGCYAAEFANDGSEGRCEMLVAFTNEIAIGEDGWAQIAPFGDFPGMAIIADGKGGFTREKAIQRMDRKAVTQMVNEFTASQRGARKFLKSRPIFLGHPDMPGGAAKYPDANPKGVFANVVMREPTEGSHGVTSPTSGGFYGEPILTDDGEQLVASKKVRAFSGRWEADEYLGEEVISGTKFKVFRPTKFLSAGLTDRPNLPVELFNSEETANNNQNDNMKKTQVIALFGLLGIMNKGVAFANDASDEDVSEGLKQLGEKCTTLNTDKTKLEGEKVTLANEKATLAGEKAALEGKVNTLTTEKGTLTTELGTARTNFANERQARIGEMLDGGIKAGLITQADRATWETRLKNDTTFANEAEAFKKLAPKVKTTSVTLDRGDRKVEISNASERREMVTELVNEEMTSTKCDYDKAFAKVQKKFPSLFEAMEAPVVRKGGAKKA